MGLPAKIFIRCFSEGGAEVVGDDYLIHILFNFFHELVDRDDG